jgi:uncharacterized membrane protein
MSAYAVFAAGGKADFSIAASPSSQTVSQGQSTTFTVTVTRANGFAGAVSLAASGLPSGATAGWKLSDGSSSNIVPPSLNSATLTIQTAPNTPNGTSQPLITATSDKLVHTSTVTIAVQPAAQPNFVLAASPSSQTTVQGDVATYTVNVNRTGGYSGTVSLDVSGLPKGVTASWSPSSTLAGTSSTATLTVQTAGNTQADTNSLTITGSGTIAGSSVSRSAAVTLIVQKNLGLQLSGDLAARLAPERKVPLNLAVANPNSFTLQVTNIAVAIEEATSIPSCSGTQNFRVTQMPSARYPLSIAAGQTKTLDQLGVADSDKPQIEMINRPWNQDACKAARLSLSYAGSATK